MYQNLYMNLTLSAVIDHPAKAEILALGDTGDPRTFPDNAIPRVFRQVVDSRILKVGFSPSSIPYSYYNNRNELVGFDISYAYNWPTIWNAASSSSPSNLTISAKGSAKGHSTSGCPP